MKNLYVVNTNYHIYLTILKANYDFTTTGVKADLILTDHLVNPLPKDMIKAFNSLNIFDKVLIMPDASISQKTGRNLEKLFTYKTKIIDYVSKAFNDVNLNPLEAKYEKVFIFLDYSAISHYLMIKKIPLQLIEDGIDIYYSYNENWRNYIDYIFGIPRKFGLSKYIENVWVLYPEKLPQVLKKKAKLYNIDIYKKECREDLTHKMTRLFIPHDEKKMHDAILKVRDKKVFLLLTQSYSEFGHMSEEKKIDIYKKTIEKYANKDHFIIIKSHPKETTDYQKVFGQYMLLPGAIPIELISDLFVSIDTCVSINSTAQLNIRAKHNIMIEGEFNEKGWKKYMNHLKVKENI